MSIPLAPESWVVLDHGVLETITDGLWRISGSLPNTSLPRCCVIARHTDPIDGSIGLLVHSAVSVDDDTLRQVLDLAPPRWLVVPNAMHRLDAPAWKDRFPELQVLCPPEASRAVSEKLPVDATLEDVADRFTEASGVVLRRLAGVGGKEWVMLAHHSDGGVSLVVSDAIFNLPHQPGFSGLMMRLMGSSGGPRVTFIARRLLVSDRAALAEDLRRLAGTPGLRRIIPAHGEIIDADAAGTLRRVADAVHS